jgi:predicted nucleotidyltransferase
MNTSDPNVSIVELVADALGDLRSELVLVGGCSVGLLITDRARPAVRQTVDVDLVAEVASLGDYYEGLSPRLRACGFVESGDHMCRWTKGSLIIDVMPSRAEILGHSVNRWYEIAVQSAEKKTLPSGLEILVVSAPMFLSTKIEAFHSRGNGDYLGSTDMEDIINVIDGRPELIEEVRQSPSDVRSFLEEEFDNFLADEAFSELLPGHLPGDEASQRRVPLIIERLRQLAGL